VTLSPALFEAAIWVKSTHLIKSCFKTRKKKRKHGNKRNFYINHHLTDMFRHRIHSLLRRADARGCADIITVYDAYRYICASGIVIEVRK